MWIKTWITTTSVNWGRFSVTGSDVIVPGEGQVIDLSATPANTLVNINVDFQFFSKCNFSSVRRCDLILAWGATQQTIWQNS